MNCTSTEVTAQLHQFPRPLLFLSSPENKYFLLFLQLSPAVTPLQVHSSSSLVLLLQRMRRRTFSLSSWRLSHPADVWLRDHVLISLEEDNKNFLKKTRSVRKHECVWLGSTITWPAHIKYSFSGDWYQLLSFCVDKTAFHTVPYTGCRGVSTRMCPDISNHSITLKHKWS